MGSCVGVLMFQLFYLLCDFANFDWTPLAIFLYITLVDVVGILLFSLILIISSKIMTVQRSLARIQHKFRPSAISWNLTNFKINVSIEKKEENGVEIDKMGTEKKKVSGDSDEIAHDNDDDNDGDDTDNKNDDDNDGDDTDNKNDDDNDDNDTDNKNDDNDTENKNDDDNDDNDTDNKNDDGNDDDTDNDNGNTKEEEPEETGEKTDSIIDSSDSVY